jgi:small-conductance mechanosensitive channel
MRAVVLLFVMLTVSTALYAASDANVTQQQEVKKTEHRRKILLEEKKALDTALKENNIWSKIYSNYHIYLDLKKQQRRLTQKIDDLHKLAERRILNKEQRRTLQMLEEKRNILQGKLQLLKEYEKDPFKKFLTPPKIGKIPQVDNPVAIISAISFQEKLKNEAAEYDARFASIEKLMRDLRRRKDILERLYKLSPHDKTLKKELKQTVEQLKVFTPVYEIFKTTRDVYLKKIDEIRLNLSEDIKKEVEKATTIGIILFVILLSIIILKLLVKRYMSDNERFYTINKFLNILFVTLALIVLLFAYIENVDYLVTILGFASAGIAIAMKDWFMSVLGWFVIIIGGAVHVGDRVKFVRNGMEYVGDIIDISLLRMTIQEDITLTTYMHNRRAGRIIFVPNNYIFTDMIANYSHAGLKTVWDGIDFVITFDSNVAKAAAIAKEVTKKYSKGYTEITRKQLNKLRSQYSVKNTNVEPRIYSFIESYGIKISAWYHTNAYATLTLRSTISMEIIERIQQEDDITLSYPTQAIYLDKQVPKPKPPSLFDTPVGEEA